MISRYIFSLATSMMLASVVFSYSSVNHIRKANNKYTVTNSIFQLNNDLQQILINFDCNKVNADELSEFLLEIGMSSVGVEVVTENELYLNDEKRWNELGQQRSWSKALLRAIFPSSFDVSSLDSLLASSFENVNFEIIVENVENKDWISHVQQNWQPQIIGNLTVRFPWHESHTLNTRHELILEGGAAFGTGDHPTTRLCCRWLEKTITSNKDNDFDVLDVGCGSGILGLAALKFGARSAAGTDIDKDSLVAAAKNCIANKLKMDLYVVSDVDDESIHNYEDKSIIMNKLKGMNNDILSFSTLDQSKEYDVVVANILAPVLISMAPSLKAHVRRGGLIGLSGIVSPQADAVIEKFQEYFCNVKIEEMEENWVLITGMRAC